jgi:transposase-like protein
LHTLQKIKSYFKERLNKFDEKWGKKYQYAVRSWRTNWDDLTTFFDYPLEIRKIIYTTNLIENLNRNIRKYTKSKVSFPNDDAVKKAVFLAISEIEKKWTQAIRNWAVIFNQFIAIFADRILLRTQTAFFHLHKILYAPQKKLLSVRKAILRQITF